MNSLFSLKKQPFFSQYAAEKHFVYINFVSKTNREFCLRKLMGITFYYFGILTWHRGHCDQQGSSPRSRLFHCTSVELKPAIPPNVGNSGA